MSNIAYIRVSSYGQSTDRQLANVNFEFDKIFTEKVSAKDTNRPKLKECMDWVREGDILHVHSIDRLARNLQDLQTLVQYFNDKGVTVHFHKEALLFSGDDNPMQKLMLQMLGAISEFERALINERRKEGMAAAKAAGKQVGAKRKLSGEDIESIKTRLSGGESKKALAAEYGVSRQTLYDALKLVENAA